MPLFDSVVGVMWTITPAVKDYEQVSGIQYQRIRIVELGSRKRTTMVVREVRFL